MPAELPETTPPDAAVEFLADESSVPVDVVAHLYDNELTRLGTGARVTAFLPIFAFRKVRETLRLRGVAAPAIA